jgi:hypothetical protein
MTIIDCTPNSNKTGGLPAGCWDRYKSKEYFGTEEGHVLAPWVAIDFVDQQKNDGESAPITVSNHSSESTNPKHCAVIKSFSLGHSDGTDVRVVIHDTQGGNFEEFMKHLVKDWMCMKDVNNAKALLMKVQFGWAKSGCSQPLPKASSPCYYVMTDSVEANFSEGKIIFEITGHDMCTRMPDGGVESQKGGDGDQSMYLIDAMQLLMCDSMPPNIGGINFKLVGASGEIIELDLNKDKKFHESIAKTPEEQIRGPKTKWLAQGRNKLEIIRSWLDIAPSINNKPWVPRYDSTVESGTVTFWELSRPECKNESDTYWDKLSLGTYVVNAGKFSPVLEFNPKIKWDFGVVTSIGGAIGNLKANAMENQGSKNDGNECLPSKDVLGAGQTQSVEPPDASVEIQGDRAEVENAKVETKTKKAIQIGQFNAISADLIVVGDPTFCPPFEAINIKCVSVIVINPFHLSPTAGSCGEWLATPACNPVLSNKGWIIRTLTHNIDAGKYTTTIGLELTSPGIDFPSSGNFGAWTGGWKPPTTCA